MKLNRRKFLENFGLSTVGAMSLPGLLSASPLVKRKSSGTDSEKLVCLFQGDSITEGGRSNDQDWNHLMGQSYPYLISSKLWYDYPERDLMFYNRGVSGDRVQDLEVRWQKDTLDLKPDVLTILIGVNDVIAVIDNPGTEALIAFEDSYKRILDSTRENLPKTCLVLCEPFIFPFGWAGTKTEMWLKEINARQEIVKKLANDYDTLFIEFQQLFNSACNIRSQEYWMWDGVHPMPAGHELIARAWIEKVGKESPLLLNA